VATAARVQEGLEQRRTGLTRAIYGRAGRTPGIATRSSRSMSRTRRLGYGAS